MRVEETLTVKKQLKISLPMAFENFINILMTLVDTLYYGILFKYINLKELKLALF